jgi:WD40 repeat protein
MGGARRVAWSSKGDWLVSCGEDGQVNSVEYPKGKRRIVLLMTDKPVWSVGWSPDNKWIAAVGDEGRVWIWSTSVIEPSTQAKETGKSEKNAHPNRAKPNSSPKRHSREKFSPFDWFHRHSS